MFDFYYCPRVVRRLQKGRDAAVLADFLGHLHRRGHARSTVHQYVRAAEQFLRWLRRRRMPLASTDELTARRFACRRRSARKLRHTTHAALRQLLHYLRLRRAGRTQARAAVAKPALEGVVAEYDAHLDHVCGLSAATRLYRRRYAREFMQFVFGSGRTDWRRARPEHVHDFVTQYGADGRVAAAQVAVISLRSFLRWLQLCGRVNARLVASVPRFPRWRLASLPTVLLPDQLRSFLASFNKSRPSGGRDYAMALCMVDLGLRVGEVADLRIDDVDA
ncbi:MAG TPA: site-specific integrase, partial [Planctomycetaceae bacterium]|nr:site-specific integrase [Planctomycetaceae bacterium]